MLKRSEWYYILLALSTILIWLSNEYSFILAMIFYPIIFILLIIKKRPISDFIIVLLFSVMSVKIKTGIYKIDYILITSLFFYSIFLNIKNKFITIGNLFLPLIIYSFYNILSILWTPDKFIGLEGVVAILEGYMMYYIVTNSKISIKKEQFIKISKSASLILITLSFELIMMYFETGLENILSDKSNITLGWGTSNLIGAIFVLLLPVSMYKYLVINENKILFLTCDIISIFGLLLTLSRGAYLGFAIAFVLLLLFYVKKHLLLKYSLILGSIFASTFFLLNIFNLFDDLIIRFINRGFFTSSNRLPLYKLAWESFLDNFLFGNGVKSSEYLIEKYLGRHEAHFHNFILQIASTLGIVGLILFSQIAYNWVKILKKPKEPYVMIVLFSIVGALIHQLLDVSFDLHYFGVYFYILISTVEIYRHNLENDPLKMRIIEKLKE